MMILLGRVTKDALWNLFGQVAPMVAAIFSIPPLIRALGEDRFAVLALAWMVLGYFGFFDLGLGRALTQLVAKHYGSEQENKLGDLVGTAITSLAVLGFLGGLILFWLAPWLTISFLKVPHGMSAETMWAFRLMGLSVPLVILTSALRGIVEGRRMFAKLNMVRVPLGLFTFLGPWLMVLFHPRLIPVLGVLLVGRCLGVLAHGLIAWTALPGIKVSLRPRTGALRSLLHLGGWMTVSNVVGPLMVNLDRFVIGAMLSLAAVTYYATPYEIVTKLLVIGSALSGAFFPLVSAARNDLDFQRVQLAYMKALRILTWVLGPLVIGIVLGARWGMSAWLSKDFAINSASILQILAIGVFFNALASIPFALIQGLGRPDLTGILHLAELSLYLLLLWVLIRVDGIRGAAWAWTIRVSMDALLLGLMARRLLHHVAKA